MRAKSWAEKALDKNEVFSYSLGLILFSPIIAPSRASANPLLQKYPLFNL
jgi:hypothetical protein